MSEAQIVHDEASYYHSVQAISNSGMNKLLKSPAHFFAWWDNVGKVSHEGTSEALVTGSLFHAMALEPDTVDGIYAMQTFSGTTKDGKAQLAEFKERGLTPIKADMWKQCEAMAANVRQHPLMVEALKADDFQTETSIYWNEGDIPCKARLDAMATIPGFGLCIIDLKSTQDAAPDEVSRSMWKYGYHRQAAWYRRALRAVGMEANGFVLMFTEKTAPYVVTAAKVCEAAEGDAVNEIKYALDRFSECNAANHWPGYVEDVIDLDLPKWARK